jgi:flagellar basal body-associated protein FliL
MADKEKDEKGEAPDAPASDQPKKKKTKSILLVSLPIVGAILGVIVVMAIPKPGAASATHESSGETEKLQFSIPEVKANLARSGGLHFCGVDIHVELVTKNPSAVADRLGLRSSGGGGHGGGAKAGVPTLEGSMCTAVRDRIILLLNSKSIDDLEGREKKELLKREIKDELEPLLFPEKDGEIGAVLFKEMLIQ